MVETPELGSKFLKKLKELFQSFDGKVKVEIKLSEIFVKFFFAIEGNWFISTIVMEKCLNLDTFIMALSLKKCVMD